jgi:hypothetical protein
MEPLEEPPGGDVDIAEIKKRYGKNSEKGSKESSKEDC